MQLLTTNHMHRKDAKNSSPNVSLAVAVQIVWHVPNQDHNGCQISNPVHKIDSYELSRWNAVRKKATPTPPNHYTVYVSIR